MLNKMYHESFLGGAWAALGSTLGKLSGSESLVVSITTASFHLFQNLFASFADFLKKTYQRSVRVFSTVTLHSTFPSFFLFSRAVL